MMEISNEAKIDDVLTKRYYDQNNKSFKRRKTDNEQDPLGGHKLDDIMNPSHYSSQANSRLFSPDEDAKLLELVELSGNQQELDWEHIAKVIGSGASKEDCWSRWYRLKSNHDDSAEWNREDDLLLAEAVAMYEGLGKRGGISWLKVSEHVGRRWSPKQCRERFHSDLKQKLGPDNTAWTPDENALFVEAIELYEGKGRDGNIDLDKVAEHMKPKKTYEQCFRRWQSIFKTKQAVGMNSGPWNEDEDNLLLEAINMFNGQGKGGRINWIKVAEHMGGKRSYYQCINRWHSMSKSTSETKTGLWSEEEDSKLIEAVATSEIPTENNRVDWNLVAQKMGGTRTPQQCRGRWNATLKSTISGDMKNGQWSNDEDALLVEAVGLFEGQGKGGSIDWAKVAEYIGGKRSSHQCRKHWNITLKPKREIKRGPWTIEEDTILANAVSNFEGGSFLDWSLIAEQMGGKRSSQQCFQRWNSNLKPRMAGDINSGQWTPEEDAMLTEAVALFDGQGRSKGVDWRKLAEHIGGKRSSKQCRERWNITLKPRMTGGINRGPWSQLEDSILIEAVAMYDGQGKLGSVDWNKVAEHMGGKRSYKQCKDRWSITLKPRIAGSSQAGPWTLEEDSKLVEAVKTFEGHGRDGTVDWGKVAEYMGSKRTSQQCRNRWHATVKPRISGDMNAGPWSLEEDTMLVEAVSLLYQEKSGNIDWNKVATHMGGKRSSKQCRSRWNCTLKPRMANEINEKLAIGWQSEEL